METVINLAQGPVDIPTYHQVPETAHECMILRYSLLNTNYLHVIFASGLGRPGHSRSLSV